MKFFSKKKNIILLFVFICFNAFSFENKLSVFNKFDFAQLSHFLYSERGYTRSVLHWNMTPFYKYGLCDSLNVKNFQLDFSSAFALPLQCGTFLDSDFLSSGLEWYFAKTDIKTQLSFDSVFSFSYSFSISKKINFIPSVFFMYRYDDISSYGGLLSTGDAQYTGLDHNVSWDNENARHYIPSRIYFTRHSIFPFLAVSFDFLFTENFSLSSKIAVSPVSYFSGYDYHSDENDNGIDESYGMKMEHFASSFYFDLKAAYKLNYFSLYTDASFLYTPETKGDLFFQYNDGSYSKSLLESCGTQTKIFSISFGLLFSF